MQSDETPNPDSPSNLIEWIPRSYLYAGVGVLGLLIIVATVAAVAVLRQPASATETNTEVVDAPTPIVTPTILPTQLPPVAAAVLPQQTQDVGLPEPTPTDSLTSLPLPTVTPAPELPPAAPRDVIVSGSTTMRLSLSGEGFDSTGRPLSFEIQPRTTLLGGDLASSTDTWCMQLGLVHEAFDLTLSLTPGTEELVVSGTIALREGFCDQPGEEMDRVDVSLVVPTDAAGQISYNLRGERSLLGLNGLLDTDTGSIVELRVANTRPE
jgi:hypothetical protein